MNKKSGALLYLDIRKAFDTSSHRYINEAYQFFNFREHFIKWLNLIGTNRRACIILENDMYSEFFNLERGNAQGKNCVLMVAEGRRWPGSEIGCQEGNRGLY